MYVRHDCNIHRGDNLRGRVASAMAATQQKYAPAEPSFITKATRIASVVAAYWFVSISLVFLNKYLLSSKDLKLDAPLFVTWFQCIVCVVLFFLLSLTSKLFPNLITFPEFRIDTKIMRETLPLSIVFVAMIASNNLCLKYVGVAFYYVVRSLTTVFNVILSYVILKQTTSCKAISCCAIIIAGFSLGVNQEGVAGSLSVLGVIFGVSASLFVALNAIYTKKMLPVVDDNVWRLGLYTNVNAIVLFLPLMFFTGEHKTVLDFPKLFDPTFMTVMLVSGLFGFAIGYVTGLQIQVTSPLTHNISGTAKACAQTIIATVYYSEVKDYLWWFSNATVLFGSLAYTHVQMMDMKRRSNDKPASQLELGEAKGGGTKDLASSKDKCLGSNDEQYETESTMHHVERKHDGTT